MAILNLKSNSERQQRIIDQYREKILGKSCVVSSPEEYWEIGLITELGTPLSVWKSYPLRDRAKIMARQYLANMIHTIDDHYQEQEEIRKKNNKGDDSGEKPPFM